MGLLLLLLHLSYRAQSRTCLRRKSLVMFRGIFTYLGLYRWERKERGKWCVRELTINEIHRYDSVYIVKYWKKNTSQEILENTTPSAIFLLTECRYLQCWEYKFYSSILAHKQTLIILAKKFIYSIESELNID